MDLERRTLQVKRPRSGGWGKTEEWGAANTNVEQVALLRSAGSGSLPARRPGPGNRSRARVSLAAPAPAASEAGAKALSKVHSVISIPPAGEPWPPGGPGSHCFINVYHRWKTAGTHCTGHRPTQKCPRGKRSQTASEGPCEPLPQPGSHQHQIFDSLLVGLPPASTGRDSAPRPHHPAHTWLVQIEICSKCRIHPDYEGLAYKTKVNYLNYFSYIDYP